MDSPSICHPPCRPKSLRSFLKEDKLYTFAASVLKVTNRSCRNTVWRSTPTSIWTSSASGEFRSRKERGSALWLMLQAAWSILSTTRWRKILTGTKTINGGDQPTAKLPHRVRSNRCVRHLQVVEDNRQHQKRSGNFKRAGRGPLLPLPLCGMRRHQSLPSCCLRLCLSFILLFEICSLLFLG